MIRYCYRRRLHYVTSTLVQAIGVCVCVCLSAQCVCVILTSPGIPHSANTKVCHPSRPAPALYSGSRRRWQWLGAESWTLMPSGMFGLFLHFQPSLHGRHPLCWVYYVLLQLMCAWTFVSVFCTPHVSSARPRSCTSLRGHTRTYIDIGCNMWREAIWP